MTIAELQQLWIQAGGDPSMAQTMAAIAMAESSGAISSTGDYVQGSPTSFGLWQIHLPAWPQFDAQTMMNPIANAQAAMQVLKQQGLSAWSTYNSGAYRQYLTTSDNGPSTNPSQIASYPSMFTKPGVALFVSILGALLLLAGFHPAAPKEAAA